MCFFYMMNIQFYSPVVIAPETDNAELMQTLNEIKADHKNIKVIVEELQTFKLEIEGS